MPIANLFCRNKKISAKKMENLVIEWAEKVGIKKEDICINVITEFAQFGQKYDVFVNLYLPTLWNQGNVKKIQSELLKVITKYLKIEDNQVLIITSMINSENVVEKGKVLKW